MARSGPVSWTLPEPPRLFSFRWPGMRDPCWWFGRRGATASPSLFRASRCATASQSTGSWPRAMIADMRSRTLNDACKSWPRPGGQGGQELLLERSTTAERCVAADSPLSLLLRQGSCSWPRHGSVRGGKSGVHCGRRKGPSWLRIWRIVSTVTGDKESRYVSQPFAQKSDFMRCLLE